MEDYQTYINWAIMFVSGTAVWLFHELWNAIAMLKKDLQKLEVELPNTYVKQAHFDSMMKQQDDDRHREHDEVMAKLESIDGKFTRVYDKLELKADK